MRVAVISDLPRLSPAEALEDYQKKGLIAPGGTDVYSDLKALLADYLYDVHYINPRTPSMPSDVDVLLWMQPRRDSGPILLLLSQHLAQGGKAIVAMQHFNIQQRQYRGSGFQTVYWPQPPIPRPRPLPPALWRRTGPRSTLRPHPVAPRPRNPSQPHGRARVRPAKGRLAFLDPRRRSALRPHLADYPAPRRSALYLGKSLCPEPVRTNQRGQ